jgi:Cu+-exporting ATPase
MDTSTSLSSDFYTLDIGGMTCASCVGRIEKTVQKMSGVEAISVNLATEQARIRIKHGSSITIDEIIKAIDKTGYEAHPNTPLGKSSQEEATFSWGMDGLTKVIISFALATPLVLPMVLMPFGIHFSLNPWWQLAVATPIQFILGWRFYIAGFKSLLAGVGNMDLLIAIGTSSAYGLSLYLIFAQSQDMNSLYFEGSAVIISMVLLGKWLEARAKKQTSEAIRALQKLWPENAKVLDILVKNDALNLTDYRILPIEQVLPTDRVIVLPGERIPVDGMILFGQSHVNESLLTGESEPVRKQIQDQVIGGSMNGEGALIIQAQAIGIESVLSKIISLVEEAQTQKAPIQKLVDQVSAIFVPSVIAIAILTGLANFLYLDSVPIAILRAVSVLVIACPCALGLATPAAIMAGTGVAARFGILIKDPQVLEIAHRINVVAFDKTGTLTIGHPRLIEVIPLTNEKGNIQDILATAAGLQLGSEHPLAKALLEYTSEKNILPISSLDNQAIAGIGIEGKPISGPWANEPLCLQSIASLKDNPQYKDIEEQMTSALLNGNTISILRAKSGDSSVIAAFMFGDEIKANAKQAVEALRQLGIRTAMISGDNQSSADRVGKIIGIDEVFAQVMPSDKADIIEKLKTSKSNKDRQWVAMIGDGINDAPALAIADVGMAMSTGTDVAIQSAGITLMRGDLSLVPNAIDISKRTWNKIRQNLFWAFIFNTAGIPLAALGYLSPMVAGSAMALSSFFVLSNALLLKKWHIKDLRD